MNIKNRYFKNKRLIVEIIIVSIFGFFITPYLGIPDIYDKYIFGLLTIILIFHILIYLNFIKNELMEILKDEKNGK